MNAFEVNDFLNSYCDFSNPNHVWMLKGISRNKDNDKTGVKFIRRLVMTCPEDFITCRNEILTLANDPNTTYRLYVSLNSRDAVNGAIQFQKKLIDVSIGLARGQEDALGLSKKIGSLWKTELEQKHNRGTKRILLDVDNEPDEHKAVAIVDYINKFMDTTVHCMRKTVSGWAIVIDACDTRELIRLCKSAFRVEIDLQRDSMVFLEQWQGAI